MDPGFYCTNRKVIASNARGCHTFIWFPYTTAMFQPTPFQKMHWFCGNLLSFSLGRDIYYNDKWKCLCSAAVVGGYLNRIFCRTPWLVMWSDYIYMHIWTFNDIFLDHLFGKPSVKIIAGGAISESFVGAYDLFSRKTIEKVIQNFELKWHQNENSFFYFRILFQGKFNIKSLEDYVRIVDENNIVLCFL